MKILCICVLLFATKINAQQPIKLSSINPNYLEYKGKPFIIVSSSEHYGSVYNLDFDYYKHLETLSNNGLNFSKIFLGLWSMPDENVFGLSETPFKATKDKSICPWEKTAGKYDLDKWNPVFFNRLHSMIAKAEQRDIIIEITLFASFYMQKAWETSPFYYSNNINNLDSIDYKKNNIMFDKRVFEYQEKLVRKIVVELNKYNNIYFEIQNEPWSDNPNLQGYVNLDNDSIYRDSWQKMVEVANDASIAWQKNIAQIIVNQESSLPKKHLIAQNIGNFCPVINEPDTNISIYNFHYALPVAAIRNLHLKKVMAFDETGFMPHNDYNYRREAWQFILGGGGVYNNLDYSFIVSQEDGTHPIKESTPGWGGVEFRKQMGILKSFIQGFDFVKMKPMAAIIYNIGAANVYILGEYKKQYALYFSGLDQNEIMVNIPSGKYVYEWVNPVNGQALQKETIVSIEDKAHIKTPLHYKELALKVVSISVIQ